MSDNESVRNTGITSDERIRNVLRRHIRKALDTREFTRGSLSEESGVALHHIDGILTSDKAKHRRVAAEDALCLAYALGDAAVNALVGTILYSASRLDESSKINPNMLVASMLPHVSTIALAAADGRIDHVERPGCREAADHIIATVLPLSSAGEGE